MQARQLEVFCMLMRCGTVTGAAGMLNISQPALSQILLHAEDQLGFKLFDRVRGRLVPTQEANELYPEAERIFSELGALRRRTVDMRHGRTGLVRLAASAPPSMSIVPKALTAFREAHPDIVVRSLVAPIANIRDMLRSGDVLLGVAMDDMPHHDIDVETVGHAELVCLMPEGHRLAGRAELGFADLAEETLISYRVDTLPGRLLAGTLEAEGGVYAPAVEIDLSITALPFVREGIGVAVVDGLLPWTQFSGLVQRPFRPRIRMPIAILTSKERPLSGSHALMRDCIRKAARALEPNGS
ncbi:LysR family transcriptional regulator [Azospirillum sp. TSA6c]|uniref:LysR family transcriptional regulator n=1 Tax=unclassified Azospirillum TaxID=2630922 RepID=UPI000D6097B4|nr:LysR family transcriptional regulator [Azospirillum sp. TSA6c]PWC48975.1 transcriptional regulator [Azospirillum sp. TSA6c]